MLFFWTVEHIGLWLQPRGFQLEVKTWHTHCSLLFVSVYLNAYSQLVFPCWVMFTKWAKCNFIFKNCTNSPSVELSRGSAPMNRLWMALGLMWESQMVCMTGSLSWQAMKVQGVESWTALCGLRSLCVSLRCPLSLGKSHNASGLKMKGLELMSVGTLLLQASGRTEPGCFLVDLAFSCPFVPRNI